MAIRTHGFALAVLMLGLTAVVASPVHAGSIPLYTTGFEPPTFVPGPLEGQDGWFAFEGLSKDAATVSTQSPKSGAQSVRIDGAALQPFLGSAFVGSYLRNVSFDPIGNGLPIVKLSADINVLGLGESCVTGLSLDGMDILVPGAVAAFGFVGLNIAAGSSTGSPIIQNQDGTAIVSSTLYNFGEWANVTALFDFANEIVRGVFNGELIGDVPFSSAVGTQITAVEMFMAGPQPPNLTAQFDNLSVTAVPEPGTLTLLSTGVLGFLRYARCRRKRMR